MSANRENAPEHPVLACRGRFRIRVADTPEAVAAAQRLRGRVFGAERGTSRGGAVPDEDVFDRQFRHLVVEDAGTGETVGTYRFQTGLEAAAGRGFYAETEYRIDGLPAIRDRLCEVGRACVAEAYRSGAVIALLWAGIAELRRRLGFRYMMGCVSLDERDPGTAWALYDAARSRNELSPLVFGRARPAYSLPRARPLPSAAAGPVAPLFKGYLRLGAKIAGEPAWDREFHSVDLLFLLDFARLNGKYARHFEVDRPSGEAD